MIWLTWRHLRTQAVVVYAALASVVLALVVTAGQLADLYRTDPANFLDWVAMDRGDTTLYALGFIGVLVLPGVIGAFWGAPLVARELEAGTHRLVWSQSVTRTRWLTVKLGGVGLVAVVAAGLLSLAVTWWCGPIDEAASGGYGGSTFVSQPRITPLMFGARGVVPVAYTAFAFALGVTVGIMLRRTVAAIAITLVVFVGVQVAVTFWVRPHLAEPVKIISVISVENLDFIQAAGPGGPIERIGVDVDGSGAWLLSDRTLDPTGRVATVLPAWLNDCVPGPRPQPVQSPAPLAAPGPPSPPNPQMLPTGLTACFDRLEREGYRQEATVHPASSYWRLQWTESAIYLAATGLLVGLSFWWTRRRLS